jgi:hypothetical protein
LPLLGILTYIPQIRGVITREFPRVD